MKIQAEVDRIIEDLLEEATIEQLADAICGELYQDDLDYLVKLIKRDGCMREDA